MKMQKSAIFVKKRLRINMLKIKKYGKVRDYCLYVGEYRGAAHSTCNLKNSIPKEILEVFWNLVF